jgi:hypothetical protein
MDIAECSLAELMDDPLVGLVMKSDGVNRAELEHFLERVARAICERLGRKPLSALLGATHAFDSARLID